MDHSLATSLSITVIGMTLLFLALVFFYGLMSLMMSVLRRREAGRDTANEPEKPGREGIALQAAAIAVALARAEAEQVPSHHLAPRPVDVDVSSAPSQWWSLHHSRHLASSSQTRRIR